MAGQKRRALSTVQGRTKDHRENRFLAALSPDDFAALEAHFGVVELRRGTVLYDSGDTIRYAYFPHDAMISLLGAMENGHLVEVALFGREGLCGLLGALVNREAFGRYSVQIPGTASRIALERLHEIIQMRPQLRRQVASYSDAPLAQAFQTVACNAVHSVEERCCRWVLSTRDRVDRDALPLTHEFLAEMIAVQRTTVTAVVRTLQTKGPITQRRGCIVVTNRKGLEEAACECYGRIRYFFEKLLPGTYLPPDRVEVMADPMKPVRVKAH